MMNLKGPQGGVRRRRISDLNEVDQMICSKKKTDLPKKEKLISEEDNLHLSSCNGSN